MKYTRNASVLIPALVFLALCSCATVPSETQTQTPAPPPRRTETAEVQIDTQPEGAAILDAYNTILGYSPMTITVKKYQDSDELAQWYYIAAIPTAPGEYKQEWVLGRMPPAGKFTFFMYNTAR